MSKPVFSDVFKFEGRRNRQSYVLVQIVTYIALVAGILVGFSGLALYGDGGAVAVGASALILLGFGTALASIIAAWATAAQRVRDIGYAGPWCFTVLIPYVGFVAALFILFAAGDTRESNRFGDSELTA